jgi:ParB/RepB/Spo0J family partition protein
MVEKKERRTVAGLSPLRNAQNWQQLGRATDEAPGERLREARLIPIELLKPDESQPRQNAKEADIEELAQDIQARGILQPLIVRPAGTKYLIVAGERRYRAAQKAQLTEVPVLIRDLSDNEARMTSLVENTQRRDLDPEDEARYFQALTELGMSYRDIAAAINKSHNYVGRRMRLHTNPDHLLAYRQGLATLERLSEEEDDEAEDFGTERTNFQDELKNGAERTSAAANGTDPANDAGAETRPYATRKTPVFRPRRSLYRPFHQMITIVNKMKPEEIPQEEQQGLLLTIDKLMETLAEVRERMSATGEQTTEKAEE